MGYITGFLPGKLISVFNMSFTSNSRSLVSKSLGLTFLDSNVYGNIITIGLMYGNNDVLS